MIILEISIKRIFIVFSKYYALASFLILSVIYNFVPPSDKNKDYLAWAKSKWKDLAELKQNLVELEQTVAELGKNFALT